MRQLAFENERARAGSTSLLILGIFVFLFFFAPPEAVGYIDYGIGHYALIFGELACYAFLFVKWIIKGKISPVLLLVALLVAVILVSTAVNHGSVYAAFRFLSRSVFMIMLLDVLYDRIDVLWKACVIYLSVMILINFVTILMFPEGMIPTTGQFQGQVISGQPTWFFESKNGLGKYLFCLLFFQGDLDQRKRGGYSPQFYLFAVISMISLVLVRSVASIVTFALFFLLTLLVPLVKKFRWKLCNIFLLLAVHTAAFVFVIFGSNNDKVNWLLTNVLGKSTTYSGRTPIWNKCLEMIARKPILGHGFMRNDEFREFLGIRAASNAHNLFLTEAVYGGLIAVAILVVVLLLIAVSLRKVQYTASGILVTFFIFSFLIMLIFEHTNTRLFWVVFAYGYYLGKKPLRL